MATDTQTRVLVADHDGGQERPLKDIFAERDKYVRRGDVELKGSVMIARCAQGVMQFCQTGPMLAVLTDGLEAGAWVTVEPWEGLPPVMHLLPDLCTECQTVCAECIGTGQARCGHLGCGGAGEIIKSWKPCDACRFYPARRPDCPECHGRGEIPAEVHQCPNCKGEKQVTCQRCHGTGRMSTGYKVADNASSGRCDACLGNGQRVEFMEQDWRKYAAGMLEGYYVLGPVFDLVLRTPPGEPVGMVQVKCDKDLDGNYPVLVTDNPEGGRLYLFGGRLTVQNAVAA